MYHVRILHEMRNIARIQITCCHYHFGDDGRLDLPGLHLGPVYPPEEGVTLDCVLLVTEPQPLARILGQKLKYKIRGDKTSCEAIGTLTPLQMSFASLLQILGYLEKEQ